MIYFNPLNNTLLDRNKNVLKKLECIFESILKEETYKESKGINPCIMCKNNVINTNNPNTCLKIDINQINIIIDTNATLDR
jgi:hypothetical protein